MSKKKKELRKQLHDVSVQRLSLYDSADSVKALLSVARFLITTKDDGVHLGLLSENDCVALDEVACDIISDCCNMLSESQEYKK